MTPVVVKLGGSYALSPLLRRCLSAIAASTGPVVVVPGGGPFADAVRAAQPVMGFDDRAAHEMALLAMTQCAVALASVDASLVVAGDDAAIATALAASRVAVWSPWPMVRDAPDIATSWDVTSDSLAIWLAARLRARRLVIVKHRAVSPDDRPETLAQAGVVDRAFPRFREAFAGEVAFAGPDDLSARLAA
jgi:5-(aminomethyl)-3-furanmethanol phosphate kinase